MAAAGRLRFAPGETQKSFHVLITDDRFDDDGESFGLALSDPAGGTLGAQSTATVRVADNDAASGPSPVKDATVEPAFFVRLHYADFRGVVDPNFEGFKFWLKKLNDNDGDFIRAEMTRAFIQSIE